MNSVIRLCCCVNRVISGNPQFCCDSITDLLEENESLHADLSLFPRLALCPPSSGNLLYNSAVLSQCEQALDQLLLASSKNSSCIIVGLPKRIGGQVIDVIAVIQNGELLALLPACGSGMLSSADPLLGYWENCSQEKLFGWDTLFCCGDLRFCICPCPVQELPLHLPRLAKTGCHAVLVPSYQPVTAETNQRQLRLVQALSESLASPLSWCAAVRGTPPIPMLTKGTPSSANAVSCSLIAPAAPQEKISMRWKASALPETLTATSSTPAAALLPAHLQTSC